MRQLSQNDDQQFIIKLLDIIIDPLKLLNITKLDSIFLVMEYAEMNLRSVLLGE